MSTIVTSLKAVLDLDNNKFVAGIKVAEKRIDAFTSRIHDAHKTLTSFNTLITFVGFTFLAKEAAKAGDEIVNLDKRLNAIANSLKAIGKDTYTAAEQMTWLTKTALQTGTNFLSLSKTWSQLAPAAASLGVDLQDVRSAMVGVAGAGAAMGASSEEIGRAFVAVRQIVGKNALQMEELRGQLGEALPNAMQIFVDGLNIMRDKGEVSFEGIRTDIRLTTVELNKLINEAKIDGATAMKALAAGTEKYAIIARANLTQISSQLENTKTQFLLGFGGLMDNSGAQRYIASWIAVLNESMATFLAGMTETATQFVEFFDKILFEAIGLIERFNTESIGILGGVASVIGAVIDGVWDFFRGLPGWVTEIGLIGAIMFGKKGFLIASVIGVAMNEIDTAFRNAYNSTIGNDAGIAKNLVGNQSGANMITTKMIFGDVGDIAQVINKSGKYENATSADQVKAVREELAKREAALADLRAQYDNSKGMPASPEKTRIITENGRATRELEQDVKNLSTVLLVLEEAMKNETGTESLRKRLQEMIGSMRTLREEAKEASGMVGQPQFRPGADATFDGMGNAKQSSLTQTYQGMADTADGAFGASRATRRRIQQEAEEMRKNLRFSNDAPLSEQDRKKAAEMGVDPQAYLDAVGKDRNLGRSSQEIQDGFFAKNVQTFSGFSPVSKSAGGVRQEYADWMDEFNVFIAKYKGTYVGVEQDIARVREDLMVRYHQAMDTAINAEFGKRIEAAEKAREAMNQAMSAAEMKAMFPDEFAARAAREEAEIKFGRRGNDARVYTLSDEERQKLIIKGQILEIDKDITAEIQRQKTMGNEDWMTKRFVADLERERTALMQEQYIVLAQLRDAEFQRVADMRAYVALQTESEQIQAQIRRLQNPEFQRQLIENEKQRARLEGQNLEQRRRLIRDVEYQVQQLENRKRQLRVEMDEMILQYNQNQDPAMQNLMRERDLMQARMDEQRFFYENTMSLEQKWQLERAKGLRLFKDMMTDSIFNVITGMETMQDAFMNIIRNMTGAIMKFFIDWAVGWAMAGMFGSDGLIPLPGLDKNGQKTTENMNVTAAAVYINGNSVMGGEGGRLSDVFGGNEYDEYGIFGGDESGGGEYPEFGNEDYGMFGGEEDGGITAMMEGFWESFTEGISGIGDLFSDMWSGLGDIGSDIFSGLGDGLSSLADIGMDVFSSLGDGLMSIVSSIFGGGGGGGGGGFLETAFTVASFFFHKGGMFPRHHGGALRSDEGMAILQHGELIVPRNTARETITAMMMAGLPLPAGVSAGMGAPVPDGVASGTSMVTSSDNLPTSLNSAQKGVEVVNYFDFEQVERHLQKNPGAVVNIISQDHRRRGPMYDLMRGGGKQ